MQQADEGPDCRALCSAAPNLPAAAVQSYMGRSACRAPSRNTVKTCTKVRLIFPASPVSTISRARPMPEDPNEFADDMMSLGLYPINDTHLELTCVCKWKFPTVFQSSHSMAASL